MKRNVAIFGLFIGLLLPLLGAVIMYFAWFNNSGFGEYLRIMGAQRQIAAKVLSLSLLINVLPFIYYTNKHLDLTAKGLLIATMLYFVLIVLLKFDFFA